MPIQITLGGQPCVDAIAEARNLQQLGYPAPPEFARANSLLNPRGEQPARGWFLMLGGALSQLKVNSLLTLVMKDGYGTSVTIKNLVVAKEPVCLTPSSLGASDDNAAYLVEVSDARWRCHNPYYSEPIDKQYNVRAPGYGGAYYAQTLNSGSAWTWSQMIGDIWGLMANQLGSYPGLPQGFSPDGTPERFRFQGISAWRALCQVLAKLGLAVVWNPTKSAYSIIQIGAADTTTTRALANVSKQLIFDRIFPSVVRGRVPYGVRVHFHRVQEHYGSEPATAQDTTQFVTSNVYTVDIDAPTAIKQNAESGVYHPLWDDLPALYDPQGNLLNSTALNTRAQARADAYYAMIQGTGGKRSQKIYTGLVNVTPGSTIDGVAWRQDLQSLGDPTQEGGGLVTEIVSRPAMQLRVSDDGKFEEALPDSSALHPPDLRVKEPVYPDLLQLVRVISDVANTDGTYDAVIDVWDSDHTKLLSRENVLLLPAAGEPLQMRDYLARLVGYDSTDQVPLYMTENGLAWIKVTNVTGSTANLGREITDATLNGTTTLRSLSAGFDAADVGATLIGTDIPSSPATTILGVLDSHTVTMSAAATGSLTNGTVQIKTGSMTAYSAVIEYFDGRTGAWSDGRTVWWIGANGETPTLNQRYQCRFMGTDDSNVQVWATVPGSFNLTVEDSHSHTFSGINTLKFLTNVFTVSNPVLGEADVTFAPANSATFSSGTGSNPLTAGAWATDPNTSISIPSAGTYLLFLTVSVQVDQPGTGLGSVEALLYDITNAVQISPSAVCGGFDNAMTGTNAYGVVGSGTIVWPYTATGAATVGFQTYYSSPGGSGGTAAVLYTRATTVRSTSMGYVKIG